MNNMEVVIKVRFNASKERFESYGHGKYLVYLDMEEDEDAVKVLKKILSKKLGTLESNIYYKRKNFMNDWIFEID